MRSLWSVAMLQFSKYHGCGNDFIIMTEESVSGRAYPELAREICHRQLGIGADGLIIVRQKPMEMIIYNSDGSRAPMCGNGLRCFAKYCYDEGICTEEEYRVGTLAGAMGIKVVNREPFLVKIDMGKPDFDPKRCGIQTERSSFLKQSLPLENGQIEVSSCFMGTVHTVVWLDQFEGAGMEKLKGPDIEQQGHVDLEELGKKISNHPAYSEKTNVNFAQILSPNTLRLTTYERGAGMTLACGTGACASVVIGSREGRCCRDAVVLLPYGELHIEQKADDTVMMTGPAARIARGCYEESSRNQQFRDVHINEGRETYDKRVDCCIDYTVS